MRAGLPATIARAGTSRVTTLPAPTIAPLADDDIGKNRAPEPIEAPALTMVGSTSQSARVCKAPARGRGPRIRVVDEHHAVADEHVVLDRHPFADEGVARNLAAAADAAFFWISTKAPILVSSPIAQP